MSALLVAAAMVAAAGAIAALATGDARLGLVGLAAALIGAALLADPLPSPAILGVRLTAALLAVALLRASGSPAPIRRGPGEPEHDGRSRLGWPAEILLGVAGATAGLAIAAWLASFVPVSGSDIEVAPVGLVPGEPFTAAALALAVSGAIAAIALPALLADQVGLRRATAGVLLAEGAILLRVGLAGPAGVVEEIALATLLVAVAAVAALLASAGRAVVEAGAQHP